MNIESFEDRARANVYGEDGLKIAEVVAAALNLYGPAQFHFLALCCPKHARLWHALNALLEIEKREWSPATMEITTAVLATSDRAQGK